MEKVVLEHIFDFWRLSASGLTLRSRAELVGESICSVDYERVDLRIKSGLVASKSARWQITHIV